MKGYPDEEKEAWPFQEKARSSKVVDDFGKPQAVQYLEQKGSGRGKLQHRWLRWVERPLHEISCMSN